MTYSFKYYPNRDKGALFLKTLLESGFEKTDQLAAANFLLIDYEGRSPADVMAMAKLKKPVFCYPHSAVSFLVYDGMYPVSTNITINFIPGEGQRKIMWQYKYPCPTQICGWPFGPVRDFKPFIPSEKKLEILFAPIHSIPDARKKFASEWHTQRFSANRLAFEKLRAIPNSHITVYLYKEPELHNNIPQLEDVTYIQTDLTDAGTVRIIDDPKYDLIVAADTFAYIAVAMGKPTLMFAQDIRWQGVKGPAVHWNDYCAQLRYPYELLSPNYRHAHLPEILSTDIDVQPWKSQFIGKVFDKDAFLFHVNQTLNPTVEL